MDRLLTPLLVATLLGGCGGLPPDARVSSKTPLTAYQHPQEPADPAPDPAPGATLIRHATIMTAAGAIHSPGYLLLKEGRIADVGSGEGPAPDEHTAVVDGTGMFVTPGLIDTHSHMGVYASPGVRAHSDGNEMVNPTTPQVWAEHSFWPQDPNLWRATTGGITTIQVLPGSGNLIGGRSFIAKLRPQVSARLMRFPGAPQGLKIACGENPKHFYGNKGGPKTRMGNIAGFRKAFQSAHAYRRKVQEYERDLNHWRSAQETNKDKAGDPPPPVSRDLGLETLVKVLEGEILVHNHCYRADEMHIMLDLAKEFGFKIRSFHHALEAYKLAGRLAQEEVSSSTWADWWGFKMEAFDGIPQNAALLTHAGARAIIHSDSATEIRQLNQEAAKAQAAGRKIGIELDDNQVLRWITANPAWALGVEQHTGTLEKGKLADVVIWNRHPFSVYALANTVFIDGHIVYERSLPPALSDFEIGLGFDEVTP